jgi:hypothetical protein
LTEAAVVTVTVSRGRTTISQTADIIMTSPIDDPRRNVVVAIAMNHTTWTTAAVVDAP